LLFLYLAPRPLSPPIHCALPSFPTRRSSDLRNYLTAARRIDDDVTGFFFARGDIYEDAAHHNAVFVGRDEDGIPPRAKKKPVTRSEEHTSELQSRFDLVCRLLLEQKKTCRPR